MRAVLGPAGMTDRTVGLHRAGVGGVPASFRQQHQGVAAGRGRVCAQQRAGRLLHAWVQEPRSYSFSRVHLIIVSGERYRKMSLA